MFSFVLVVSAVAGYLLGSIPFGYIIGKMSRGVDVRNYGSGKTGATNVLRTAGTGPGLLSFALDAIKGAGAVFLSGWLASKAGIVPDTSSVLYNLSRAMGGMAAIIGHDWPVFLKFQGGRGVVPTMGAVLVVAPLAIAGAALVGFTTIAISRFVSLGSILGAFTLALMILALYVIRGLPQEFLIFGVVSSLLIILQHKDNISRLVHGTERKLGQKAENA